MFEEFLNKLRHYNIIFNEKMDELFEKLPLVREGDQVAITSFRQIILALEVALSAFV